MKKSIQTFNIFLVPERKAAILLTIFVLSFFAFIWWQTRNYVETQLVNNAKVIVQDNLDSYGANLRQGIIGTLTYTESLTTFVSIEIRHDGALSETILNEFSDGIYQATNRIKNIAIAPDGVMEFIYPYEENKSVLGYQPAADQRPEIREQVQLALETGEVTISQPVELIQGGLGLISRQAVYIDGNYWGLTNMVLDVSGLLDDAGIIKDSDIDLAIKDHNGVVFYGSESLFEQDSVSSYIPLPGGVWQIVGIPQQGWEQFYSGGILIIDGMAYLIMMIVGWLVYSSKLQQQILTSLVEERTVALLQTKQELLEDIKKRKLVEKEKDLLLKSESASRTLAETLSEITLALASHIDIQSVLTEILEQAKKLIPFEAANIVFLENGAMSIRAHSGYQKFGLIDFFKGSPQDLEELPIDYEAAMLNQPILLEDVRQHPDWVTFEETSWIRSFLSVPITHQGKVLGMIRLDSDEIGRFTDQDIDRLKPMANAAAIALDNAALFEQAQSEIEERIKVENKIRTLNDQLEERVLQRTRDFETANRELEAFSYSISHDLRAPLRAISGISEIFREEYAEVLDEQGVEYLRRMDASGKKMSELIEGLLTLTQLGRQQHSSSNFILQDLAEYVFSELLGQESDRKIELIVKGRDEVEADQRLIVAMLTNLLSNALKFTRDCTPAVIEVGSVIQDDRQVFYIKDNGIGLNEEYEELLYQPFQRLHLEEEFEGTGIGLAIVKRIVQRHHGEIWVKSISGEGACFYFTLNND
jgi:signal transduction histidine kinase/sensor domain CHASE-containing protein